MNQRFFSLVLTLLFLVGVTSVRAADGCPLCSGKLVKVGKITDDQSKPSKNLQVWNRSMCANMFYDNDSVICTQCWHAYSKHFSRWERSSELPGSFRRPLSAAVRKFPLPPAKDIKSPRVVHSQEIAGAQITESVLFWCTDSPKLLGSFRDYCREHAQRGPCHNYNRAERLGYVGSLPHPPRHEIRVGRERHGAACATVTRLKRWLRRHDLPIDFTEARLK